MNRAAAAPAALRSVASEPARRRVWVEQIMGMPISVHARGPRARDPHAARAARELFTDLRAWDALFSTYRADSQLSRLNRGELTLENCDPAVREVHRLCEAARIRTDGYVNAWTIPGHPGWFDPTVLVKSWAVARAARHFDTLPELGLAIGAGGDILLRSGDGPEPWTIGIEDPSDPTRTLATVPVHDGGVATSGSAARGAHIFDPHTGEPATEVLSATVIGPSLLWADIWATGAVARGRTAVNWVRTLHGTSGMLVLADGTVHRWSNQA